MKRSLVVVTIGVVCALLIAACGGGAGSGASTTAEVSSACPARIEGQEVTSTELNLFVWTEYIPQEMLDCFEDVYGISINRNEYSSNEEMYAKLSAGTNSSYDLIQPTDQIIDLMIRQGLLEPLDHANLSVLDNFDARWLDQEFDPGNQYTIPYQAGTDAIVVNTDTVETTPESYADLWNPDYAGRLIMLDDARTVIGATLLTLGYDPNTTDEAQLNEAKERLAELVAGVTIFDSDSPKSALIAGDADLGITWTGEAQLAQDEVPAIQFVYPTEGAIKWQDTWAIPAGAPNPDAAYAFLNYINQPELFWMTMRDFPYINPNAASLAWAQENQTELYEKYMASNITNVPEGVLEAAHAIRDVGDATPLYDRIWTEVKGQ
jgi:spermidine/putrescine-binding protein